MGSGNTHRLAAKSPGAMRGNAEATSETTRTLTIAESGKLLICTKSSSTQTFTLPPTQAGVYYSFLCADAGGEINISPDSLDKIQGSGITALDNKDYINTGSSNAVGDLVTIEGDGTDGWWVVGKAGTWDRET